MTTTAVSPVLVVSALQDSTRWFDKEFMIGPLADQLRHGRIALVLGAGASSGFGLPSWDELMVKLFAAEGAPVPTESSPEMVGEHFLTKYCGDNRRVLAKKVYTQLYASFDPSADAMRKHGLLAAIGAMCMGGRRGSVRSVITLNFDDVLERYLRFYGYLVESVESVPVWNSAADVRVFHPHGFMPFGNSDPSGTPVLAQLDFDERVGNNAHSWRPVLLDILRTHTCLFIGMSGRDQNITNLLSDLKESHLGRVQGHPYWGIRFVENDADPEIMRWDNRKVANMAIGSYDRLPELLFRICQVAAEKYSI